MKPDFLKRLLQVCFLLIFVLLTKNVLPQTFVAQASAPADNGSQAGSVVLIVPPGGMSAGDLVILYAHYRGAATPMAMSALAGQSWTSENTYSGATNQTSFISWCTYTGSWSGNPSVTSGGGTSTMSVIMYVFRPTNNTKRWAVNVPQVTSNNSGANLSISGVTTTKPNTVTMAFWGSSDDNAYGTLTGSGWTKSGLTAQVRNLSGTDQSHSAAYTINSNATAIADVSQTQTALGPDPTNMSIMSWYERDPIGSRMKEVFKQTVLSPPTVLNFPWEITYGPDDSLWITESKGYKVYKMDPVSGVKRTVLDITQNSTFLPVPDRVFNCQFNNGAGAQGGLAGLAVHPLFLDPVTPKNYVYISYIYSSNGGSAPNGIFYTNRLVRFTYDTVTGLLGSPESLCDTLPGSNDHNSQRMIIAPVISGGTSYLFYASGDMGSGQFNNRLRPMRAQNTLSYEGKILRFNLETDGDPGLNGWIPNSNPYGATSAVFSIGMRNNQGFAYDTATNVLYGSSHGPYSDDEINFIEPHVNHGHPMVIGFVADGNYNADTTVANTRVSAGSPFTTSSGVSTCPPIGNEANQRAIIDGNGNGLYRDPLFSAYAPSTAAITTTWQTNPGNANWLSEGWSGLDLYSNKIIPGWKRSLVAAGLKWGRLVRLKLGPTGYTTLPSNLAYGNSTDTITYFQSTNRYRDLAFGPNGKDIYLVMDNNSATSGPGVGNPTVAACPGCVVKYSFLGYEDEGILSSIPKSVSVTAGPVNNCNTGTQVTIDATNNTLWVPITGPDGNIMAEINAMGQNLGVVNSSFYQHSGAIRNKNGYRYLNRNMAISPAVTSFATPVKLRLYISKAEYDSLAADPLSGVTNISQLRVLKNDDPCGPLMIDPVTLFTPVNTLLPDLEHGADGYVLQVNIPNFSSFYFGSENLIVPLNLLTFNGLLQPNLTARLSWKTANEINTSHFAIERSSDGLQYFPVGTVVAKGNTTTEQNYGFTDTRVTDLQSPYVFYRLKMFDTDAASKYSHAVKLALPGDKDLITIVPNPVSDKLKARLLTQFAGTATYKIVDYAGRIIQSDLITLKTGVNQLNIDVRKLTGGSYFLIIAGTGGNMETRFLKL